LFIVAGITVCEKGPEFDKNILNYYWKILTHLLKRISISVTFTLFLDTLIFTPLKNKACFVIHFTYFLGKF